MPKPTDKNDRLGRLAEIAARPRSREALEAEYGQVWDTRELAKDFIVTGIVFPYIVVRRKADDVVGTLLVQNTPRFYFDFTPDPAQQEEGGDQRGER